MTWADVLALFYDWLYRLIDRWRTATEDRICAAVDACFR